MIGYTKITKERFYSEGGFSNPKMMRRQEGKSWAYYIKA